MSDLRICRSCLSTNVTLCPAPLTYHKEFKLLTAIKIQLSDIKPQSFCIHCLKFLDKVKQFRSQSQQVDQILNQLIYNDRGITPDSVNEVARVLNIGNNLSVTKSYVLDILSSESTAQISNAQVKQEPFVFSAACDDDRHVYLRERDDLNFKQETVFVKTYNERRDTECEAYLLEIQPDALLTDITVSVKQELPVTYDVHDEINQIDDTEADVLKQEEELTGTSYEFKDIEYGEAIQQESDDPTKGPISSEKPQISTAKVTVNSYPPVTTAPYFECSLCSKRFIIKRVLVAHLKTHVETKSFACSMCDRTFKQKCSLTVHFKSHTGIKPFQCSICDKTFKLNAYLNMHMRIHTLEKPHQCAVCGKRFTQQSQMLMHARIHTNDRRFKCSVCNKRFTQQSQLILHMRTHTQEKPFKCTTCEKSFAAKHSLQLHLRTHTGEKPFPCTFCPKRFSLKMSMERHMRTHTNERPYECPICKKCFSEKSKLNAHNRTHTGERPYACPVCKKNFFDGSTMRKHFKSHNLNKP